ncbi:unnamed protein product, partial [Cyprideis torosa]
MTKPKNREKALAAFERLLDTMDELREKCPWDKKQTMSSLSHLTIEEVYEAVEAIHEGDLKGLSGELGDLFLHLVFYCKIGEEQGAFTVDSVLNEICEKLERRHPHIYGTTQVKDEEEVKANWEKIKLKEGRNSILEGVPKALPALIRAYRIQEKAAGVGFDFQNLEQIQEKVLEEIEEFSNAASEKDKLEEF